MEDRLLEYYNHELGYLRELGAEFARAYPKVAGRLGLRGTEVVDPYVERLLEGFSFLCARIHLKMDAEFPRFSQRLLEVVYPNYVAPMPAMAIVKFQPNLLAGDLRSGYTLPSGTSLRAHFAKGQQTACEFRTAHQVRLWPIRIAAVRIEPTPEDLPLGSLGLGERAQSALRISLEVDDSTRFDELPIEQLDFFLSGQENQALQLLELVLGQQIAVLCRDPRRPEQPATVLSADAIRHEGVAANQTLLPFDVRTFHGYRLLHEYFAFPARFLFFSIGKLREAFRKVGRTCELIILFDRKAPDLYRTVDTNSVALYCTPVVNLFPKRTDRIAISTRNHEHHIVVDRSRPLDYEIHSIVRVTGYGKEDGKEREFLPFYANYSGSGAHGGSYFSARREPRLLNSHRRENGRTDYTGSEVFISLVDQREAPYGELLRHVSVEALCTNRDLALLMRVGTESDFTLNVSAPVSGVRIVKGPTAPRGPIAENEVAWRLISHLGINYLTLTDLDSQQGACALRELLELYADLAEPAMMKQIQAIRSVRVEPVYRPLPHAGPIPFGRGVQVTLLLDEAGIAPNGIYLFGAVLEQFFARHVSLNSFCELVIETVQNGEIRRWKPRLGSRPIA
jgi:type VI secretion system protein ImpG